MVGDRIGELIDGSRPSRRFVVDGISTHLTILHLVSLFVSCICLNLLLRTQTHQIHARTCGNYVSICNNVY